jgi:general secretion pathway protein G
MFKDKTLLARLRRLTEMARALRAPAPGRHGRHGWQRGVTLVEVLIVVAIIAMVAGGAAVFAVPQYKKSQVTSAKTGARVIRTAIQNWQATSNETSCPTISQLVQEKQLDPGQNNNDPWGQPYVLQCTEDEVIVSSGGPDKKAGTKDDIRVPETATGEVQDDEG